MVSGGCGYLLWRHQAIFGRAAPAWAWFLLFFGWSRFGNSLLCRLFEILEETFAGGARSILAKSKTNLEDGLCPHCSYPLRNRDELLRIFCHDSSFFGIPIKRDRSSAMARSTCGIDPWGRYLLLCLPTLARCPVTRRDLRILKAEVMGHDS